MNTVSPEILQEFPSIAQRLQDLLSKRHRWEEEFIRKMSSNPLEALLLMLFGGSVLFYNAEKGRNPKINTFWDSFYFVSTCASVGYADVFAQTQAGKIISGVLNTFGPALCANVFDRPREDFAQTPPRDAIVEKLDQILQELRRIRERESAQSTL